MKLKLDENLGHSIANILRQAGHDVSSVLEQRLCGTSDKHLISVCANEQRCLVTLDLDFSNPLIFDPAQHAGIVILRIPPNPSQSDIAEAARTLIAGLARSSVSGKLWIVRRKRIREYQPDED